MILKVKSHFKIDRTNGFSLKMKYDSVASGFGFSYYFDPSNEKHKELFKPGHYHQAQIIHNDELLMTGFMVGQSFSDQPVKELSPVSGYSLPGVLQDSQIPTDLYPLQSDGLSLKEITNHLIKKFPFKLEVDPDVSSLVNTVYEKTTASPTQTIMAYLSGLASQRNVIMSHTAEGNLLYTKAKTKKEPLFHFVKGQPNTKMALKFPGQNMHSHITVVKQAGAKGGNAGEFTIKNPFVPFVKRYKVITQSSGDDNNTEQAARNALSSELKGIILTITTDMWEIDGKAIKPNNIITVENSELYLYNRTEWFIESVTLKGDEKETTATLTCVLPEVYNKETPTYIFK